MNFRQVHLDFHTSEQIKGIGKNFSTEQFQQALKTGCVNTINLFSKCHHGWAYHPSKANETHPYLDFDLLGAQITASRGIGVKTPVYISAGLDEKTAKRNHDWLHVHEKNQTAPDFNRPGYHTLCFNTPYLDYLIPQIEEVVREYDPDGLWLDIVGVRPCYCQACLKTRVNEGKDPFDEAAALELAERVYANYTKRVRDAVDKIRMGLPVFHNGGHIIRGRRDLANMNTHLDLESLPTGGWGYDHFPLSVRYAVTLGMKYAGMTGKFHTTWGEFGGFKHRNAIRYEAALCVANGAMCSIGDQLAPDGKMDMATYKLIGAGFNEIAEKEKWLEDAKPIADLALLSAEAVNGKDDTSGASDSGAVRILLEGKYLFNVIDACEDFTKYKVIILPDDILINDDLFLKLKGYTDRGGKVLATGKSGLDAEGKDFRLDLGAKRICGNPYKPDYFRPGFEIEDMDNTAYIFYSDGEKIELSQNGVLHGTRENPYFNREAAHFCSHQHAPDSGEPGGPGMTEGPDGIYIAWKVFGEYARMGSLILKRAVAYALDFLLGGGKTLATDLPAQGIVTLMEQDGRYICHLLYASPVKRGADIQVIEDILPVYGVRVSLATARRIKKVALVPQNTELEFTQSDGKVEFTVPRMECHQMVSLEY